MKKSCLLFLLLGVGTFLSAQTPLPRSANRYDSYKGLVMAGYQGWFNAPGDGAGRGFYHYTGRNGSRPGSCTIDLWPETREYARTYPTEFRYDDGSTACVFSSHDSTTVDLHFRWMQEYGLDGVFMQRFVAEIRNPSGKAHFNHVLRNAMTAANRYGRAISVMYDLSGMRPGEEQIVLEDIRELEREYALHSREDNRAYLWHNGRPLVAVWGVGFNDHRRYGLHEAGIIIDGLKAAGFSVLIGVPTQWQQLKGDTESDPGLHDLIRRCDVVMPWFVGRYGDDNYSLYQPLIRDNIRWAKENGVDYAPLCFPGFSWRNMPGHARTVQFPRYSGRFFWKQLSGAIGLGAEMIYIAMFDEIDEGTAIFKTAHRVPVGQEGSTFVPLDADVPSDHYLFLAGQAARMLRGEIPLQTDQPQRK